MSKWPLNGGFYTLVSIGIMLVCLLLFSPAAATCSNVHLNITPEDICADNTINVTYHDNSGLIGGVNGVFVTFSEGFTIPDDITTECVNITNSTGATDHPLDIKVIHNPDSNYPNSEFCFPDGTTTLKMTVPDNIRQNSNVTIEFCDLIDCPCDCDGYFVWVSTSIDKCPVVMSNTVYMKVRIESYAEPHGSIDPLGTLYYWCCDTPTYHIEADPCYLLDHITVTPLCSGGPCTCDPGSITFDEPTTEYDYTFGPLNCCYNISAYFKIKTCNVTAIAHEGGRILSPDGIWSPPNHTKVFNCSEVGMYLIKPDISYSIDDVTVDGISVVDEAGWTWLDNGSATYNFTSDCNDTVIEGFFRQSPVDVYLKWRRTFMDCDRIDEYQVSGFDTIVDAVTFSDSLYQSGNTSVFNITGESSATFFGGWDSGFISGATYGSGDTPVVEVLSLPSINPETYLLTWVNATGTHQSALTILTDGTAIWGPVLPNDLEEITDIESLQPAWQLVTQDFLDANPDWQGLIGAVVYVADGTYYETFEVDTPGLHVKAFPGADPIIDASGETPVGPGPTGAVFLSAGCTGIEELTIRNSDTNGVLVWPSSEKCQNASILHWEYGIGNISVPCSYGRINIVNNTIYGNNQNGIRVIDAVVLISGNTIYDNTDDGIDAGCLFCGVECVDPEAITHSPACSEITWNTIYGNGPSGKGEWEVYNAADGKWYFTTDPTACGKYPGWTDSGIQIRCTGLDDQIDDGFIDGDGCPAVLYIVHNNVTENYHAGIFLMENATDGGNITIEANHLLDNGIFGMLTEAEDPWKIDFKWNNIVGNTYWGVKNLDEDVLIAKENYWGEPGGPSRGLPPINECIACRCHEKNQQSNALGNGDAVSHLIEYNPWLYVPAEDIFHDGDNPKYLTRSYGSDSLLLQKGWNTLSVPCKLSEDADTIGEIEDLGDFITNQNAVVVYQWDAVADMWVDIGFTGTKIIPCRGYYILMKEPSRFPVLYNNNPSPGLPSFGLEDGWNLIGAPWGIDRVKDCCADDEGRWGVASPDAGDPEAFKPVWEALESIKEGNGGTKGVAIIVSPSVPGQISVYSASVTSGFWDPIYNNKEMATGEGYWVFMVNPGTYAGFEITPFYFA
jgi:hypothetical protein